MEGHYLGLLAHYIVETTMDLGMTVGSFFLVVRYEVLLLGFCMTLLEIFKKFVVSIYYRTVVYYLQKGQKPPEMASGIADGEGSDRLVQKGLFRLILSPSVVSIAMLFFQYRFIPAWFLLAVGIDTVVNLKQTMFVMLFISAQALGRLLILTTLLFLIPESRMIEKTYWSIEKHEHSYSLHQKARDPSI
jgi:hypothetical protein